MKPVHLLLFGVLSHAGLAGFPASGLAGESAASQARQPHRAQLAQSSRTADPECYCWAHGQRFAHGEQACIKAPSGARLATCDRVINMMSWSFSAEACPES